MEHVVFGGMKLFAGDVPTWTGAAALKGGSPALPDIKMDCAQKEKNDLLEKKHYGLYSKKRSSSKGGEKNIRFRRE